MGGCLFVSPILFFKLLILASQPFLSGSDAVRIQRKLRLRALFTELTAFLPRPGEDVQMGCDILLRLTLDRLNAVAEPFVTAAERVAAGEKQYPGDGKIA